MDGWEGTTAQGIGIGRIDDSRHFGFSFCLSSAKMCAARLSGRISDIFWFLEPIGFYRFALVLGMEELEPRALGFGNKGFSRIIRLES